MDGRISLHLLPSPSPFTPPQHHASNVKNAAWTPEVLAKFEELRAKGRCVRFLIIDKRRRICVVRVHGW